MPEKDLDYYSQFFELQIDSVKEKDLEILEECKEAWMLDLDRVEIRHTHDTDWNDVIYVTIMTHFNQLSRVPDNFRVKSISGFPAGKLRVDMIYEGDLNEE